MMNQRNARSARANGGDRSEAQQFFTSARGRLLAATSGLTLALALSAPAAAQTANWNGSDGGSWMAGGSWDGGTRPADGANVLINTKTPNRTTLGFGGIAETVTVGILGVGNIDGGVGQLNIQSGSKLAGTGLYIGGTTGAPVSGDGFVWVGDAGSQADFTGHIIVGDGTGTLQVTQGGAVSTEAGTVIGRYGTGTLLVDAGGTMTTALKAYVGEYVGGTGIVTIDGAGSSWTVGDQLDIGRAGQATLTISNGGTLTSNGITTIGNAAGSNGDATVSGSGSTWTTGDLLNVGADGTGVLTIENGGQVKAHHTIVAYGETGSGTLNVNKDGVLETAWLVRGAGTVDVNFDGGTLRATSNQTEFLSGFKGNEFSIGGNHMTLDTQAYNVTASADIGGIGGLTKQGTGTLTLSGNNSYQYQTYIMAGKISVSSDNNLGAKSAGVTIWDGGILENTAAFSSARGIRVFGGGGVIKTDADLTLTGEISGTGSLTKSGAATLTLTNTNNTYAGATTVQQGALKAGAAGAFNSASAYTVDTDGTLDLGGFDQTLKSLANSGDVRLGGAAAGTTLTIAGDYVGNGGTVYLNTVLAGDASKSDLLKIEGNTSGTGFLAVTNIGGAGAQTVEGIKIVDVAGASEGDFTLKGDYVHDGEQAVVAGAYAYKLYQGGVSAPNDGDWYLRSELKDGEPEQPLYQAGVPVYQAMGAVMQQLNGDIGTFSQRAGNRYWSGAANPIIEQGDGPGKLEDAPAPEAATDTASAVWGRIQGSHGHFEPDATAESEYDIDTVKLQAGLDGKLYENEAGSLIGGVTVHYGHAEADISSVYGDGDINVDGYGFGGTLTWLGDNGLYVDGLAQATWYETDLNAAKRSLADGVDGFGYAVSVETGKRIAIDPHWTITPQAQLTWSSVDIDSFTDSFAEAGHVSQDDDESLKGRLGIAAEYGNGWMGADGKKVQTNVYAIANLYHEFMDGSKVDVSGVRFSSENDSTWGGIGTGGTYSWADGKYAVFGEVSVDTSLENFADSYKVNGNLGMKVKW
jgi:outer membrane autotransporter protein